MSTVLLSFSRCFGILTVGLSYWIDVLTWIDGVIGNNGRQQAAQQSIFIQNFRLIFFMIFGADVLK